MLVGYKSLVGLRHIVIAFLQLAFLSCSERVLQYSKNLLALDGLCIYRLLFLSPLPSHLLRRHSIRRTGTHLVGNCRRNFEAQCPEGMSKRKLIIVFKKVPPVDSVLFSHHGSISYTNISWSTPESNNTRSKGD